MDKEKIKKDIEEILNKMTLSFEGVEIVDSEEDRVKFVIKTSESGLLIGHRGEHFDAFSHLVKRIAGKNFQDARFSLDVNNYKEEILKNIKKKALEYAEKVKSSKKSLEMEPMSSYERMVVHSLFQDDPYIETESISKEGGRRVVLKYISI